MCVSFEGFLFQGRAGLEMCQLKQLKFMHGFSHPAEVRVPGLNVQIHKVEHNPVREIAKTAVVDDKTLASVNHLEWWSDWLLQWADFDIL